jgi:hypothetical protein
MVKGEAVSKGAGRATILFFTAAWYVRIP